MCSSDSSILCSTIETPCAGGTGTCKERGLYIGTAQSFNDCDPADENAIGNNPNCCVPKSGKGSYNVKRHLTTVEFKGKDQVRKDEYPCSDDGLTVDKKCAYSTRVYRDQARNFIIRNSDRQPYLLTVALHAPHFGFASPIRTERHYQTPKHGSSKHLRAHRPNNPSKYWGIIEEMDAATGEILDLLDRTQVCDVDPYLSCDNGDCTNAQGQCIPIGRCSDSHDICGGSVNCGGAGSCQPQADNTIFAFFSDHGRPHGGSDYGDPKLRGGKGDSFEGGLKVGLLLRTPDQIRRCVDVNGDPVTPSETCSPGGDPCTNGVCEPVARSNAVGSIVDIYATLADAAGYDLNGATHYEVHPRLCSGTQNPCHTDTQCDGGSCVYSADTVVVDGRSLLANWDTPSSGTTSRQVVYGSYPGDGIIATTTAGLFYSENGVNPPPVGQEFALGTCAYDSKLDHPNEGRRARGGSCDVCDPSLGGHLNSGCTGKWCKLSTNVCVDESHDLSCPVGSSIEDDVCLNETPPDDVIDLSKLVGDSVYSPPNPRPDPGWGLYQCRTSSDCPSGFGATLKCKKNVWVKCNACLKSTWKLRSTAATGGDPSIPGPGSNPSKLFDTRSNPTEDERLNFHFQGCLKENGALRDLSAPLPGPYDEEILRVENQLLNGDVQSSSATAADLQGWYNCISNVGLPSGQSVCTTGY